MDYDLQSMDYKIPLTQPNIEEEGMSKEHSSGASRLQIKGMLQRYRRDTQKQEDEMSSLKQKLSDAYDKLSKEIELNNSNCQLVEQLQTEVDNERRQASKIKQVLQSIIQNRKHLQRELNASKEQFRTVRHFEDSLKGEISRLNQELLKTNKQHQQTQEQLKQLRETFDSRVKTVRSDNTRIENEKIKLERAIIEKDAELVRLRDDNKKFSYLHIENANLIKEIEYLKSRMRIIANDNVCNRSQFAPTTDQNVNWNVQQSRQQQPSEQVIGKWKKPTPMQQQQIQRPGRRQFSREASYSNENSLKERQSHYSHNTSESALSIDESLTIQQKRKEQIENELNKLSNLKKLTPMERKAIDQLQDSLYEVNSQIAGLKRKIRHRY